ncbi:AMP-dependent CoA ligase/synthetase [Desulfatibacillum aliphaticivorans]|uniref:AMP-dependent CoA ligase/synthetase n=1 Tax=Desulfatibacillum aliphaticivorans TaxID=218208 RepID=B8FLZ6_DESAL|nr:long-chain fatty acid--CoA ligase [Desulfatibacillum aliphaticivorans]ACL05729.1 AMP-dependent CoA ligase/synthetase [Desulfatibacillum aliphaticivorans]
MKNNVGYLLTKRADMLPDKEAFVDVQSDIRLSYKEYNANANRFADVLQKKGVKKGDRVGILMMNSHQFMEMFFAIAKIGAICVPLNWRLVPDELTFILKDSGTKLLVFGDEFKDGVAVIRDNAGTDVETWLHSGAAEDAPAFASNLETLKADASVAEPELGAFEDDPVFIMYTSGTTGLPKGAVHTHKTLTWAVINMDSTWELRQSDRFFVPLPLFHVGALMPSVMAVYTGLTIIALKAFDPSLAWKTIEAEKVTNSLMVPTVMGAMLMVPEKDTCDVSSFRWSSIAGAPVPVSLLEACKKIGINLEQLFGLTEAAGPGCFLIEDAVERKPGSAGKGCLFIDARVVDANDKPVPPNTPGELILKGKNMMVGYWNRPEDTEKTLKNGWLHTGDVATMDDEGFVYIVDRIKDMIISGGENIYPAEIEKVLAGMPGVAQVAVIGKPHEKWGEVPMAVIVPSDKELTEESVLQFCDGKIARYKLPKAVTFVEALPMTPTGKVQKRVLERQLSQ